MEDVLRMFRDATGYDYDGDVYDLNEFIENDDNNESDIEVPIEELEWDSDSDS